MKTLVIEESEPAARRESDRWTPIPPNGRCCQFTGLKHAKLYDILGGDGIARGQVRVVNLRTPGAKRGQTLFHVGDMLDFLNRLAAQQGGGQSDGRVGQIGEAQPAMSRVPQARSV
jgi:hypothetical protein